jgi:NAD(P)-dependent dehydrogenase (short-subunit alcohol dehydrogenase family)
MLDRDGETLQSSIAKLEKDGFRARGYAADVSSETDVVAAVRRAETELGCLSVLVNNAGFAHAGPTLEFALRDWREIYATIVEGTFLCSRVAVATMSRGGSIVNIGSIAGIVGQPEAVAYGSAKAAVIAMTRALAVEWAHLNIRVNAVAPGIVRTTMLDWSIDAGIVDPGALRARIPQQRFAEPDEIAQAVLYLASPAARYITGQCLCVDGGWTAFGWSAWTPTASREQSLPNR